MKTIQERIEAVWPEIRAAAHQIHEDPELGMEEFHAVATLTGLLEKYGFTVERDVCGLKTGGLCAAGFLMILLPLVFLREKRRKKHGP